MGRLKGALVSRNALSVHYHKLVNEFGGSVEALSKVSDFRGSLETLNNSVDATLCCCHCGKPQLLQAEQLNSIVGNAFRMAYAAQLQRQPSPFSELLAPAQSNVLNNNNSGATLVVNNQNNKQQQQRNSWAKTVAGRSSAVPTTSTVAGKAPCTLPGLSRAPSSLPGLHDAGSPSSDESNSPTDLNTARRLADKPPLIKRLVSVGLASPSSQPPPLTRPASAGGFENEPETSGTSVNKENTRHIEIETKRMSPGYTRLTEQQSPAGSVTGSVAGSVAGSAGTEDPVFRAKRSSQTSSASSASSGALPLEGSSRGASPPPLPERSDSLRTEEEERALHAAPWFQAGIPREIALEVLSQEPVGAFMVRESTSKPGCYALSLRVPKDFQPSGIAHYLIMRTNKGYKIKGFTKEFSTLMALITHHSVMPELLPCPLSLSRYNPSFVKSEDTSRDFADIDSDPDYDTLADFRKMMADLDV